MKVFIDWDEVYPLFYIEPDSRSQPYGVESEVTSDWLEEYRTIEKLFWTMQAELEELSGYKR